MLVGRKLGPFAIEKELGSGAMGTVYRAIYTKTGQHVAVKIMAPNLGTNERSVARFEREGAILKQLKHPNIVRLFGIGKYHNSPYYAMEYLQGESLDHVMARRGRLPWEEIVRIGTQLCDALFHAHQQGIVHRDLKPSNLMMTKEGTVKLTDFGIAKDLDVTQLTSANCTVGTASYMSPEQCRGEKDLTHKSDLYSMGIMFYELLVGRKPFQAESAMDMFMQHVQGTFERPGRLVMDTPIWLDNLICQLLEKKPEQRPRDAATVGHALSSIAEKVQAQKSAGEDVAKKRYADRTPGSTKPGVEDKETARLLLNGKFRVKRRKKVKPFFERKWVQGLGILGLLLCISGLIFLALRPPSEDKLFAEAKSIMETKSGDKDANLNRMIDAKEGNGPFAMYRRHYAKDPSSKYKDVMSEWSDEIDALSREDQLRKKAARSAKTALATKEEPGEDFALRALAYEDFGDPWSAMETWKELQDEDTKKAYEDRNLIRLAKYKQAKLVFPKETTGNPEQDRFDFVNSKVNEIGKLTEEKKKQKAADLAKQLKELYGNHKVDQIQNLVKGLESPETKTP
jgi:serine/threonine-protein kinase